MYLDKEGQNFDQGNDFKVTFVKSSEFKDQVMYRIVLWDTFQFYCLLRNLKKGEPIVQQ